MSSVFGGDYSAVYELLYDGKDSEREASYVAALIQRYAPGARSLLDLGAGTGRHGRRIAALGYDVVGVERSPQMLALAQPPSATERFTCLVGDACTIALGRNFDAVSSLFHVVSYQTQDSEVHALLTNVKRHLAPGGCFVFDVWHADAVLQQRPEVRVARRESEAVRLVRIAEPVLHEAEHVVEVVYTMFVENKRTGTIKRIDERHRMRYFTAAEIERFAAGAGLHVAHSEEWLTGSPPSAATWGVCYVATASPAGTALPVHAGSS
jgi:SAM-dependent methyltransferase